MKAVAGRSMTVLNVAAYCSDEIAKSIAKPTDQRDVHTYVYKEGVGENARIISLIRPAKYPERLRPLLNSLSVSNVGIIEVTKIDATLGEVIVAFSSAKINHGLVIINPPTGEWIDEETVTKLISQAGLNNWTIAVNDGIELRGKLFDLMEEISEELAAISESSLIVSVDQHFNVKGIGLVAIGYVQSGKVDVHDELFILPAKGTGTTKSLQVMDDDVPTASAGDRVGIALRNCKEEHLSNGSIIVRPAVEDKKTNTNIPLAVDEHNTSTLQIAVSPFQKRILAVGDVIHISVDLQFIVGRIVSVDGNQIVVQWDSPVYIRIENQAPAIISQLDSNPRIIGHAIVSLN